MEINGGKIIRNDTNQNAMGGSEIVATTLATRINPELLKEFQIVNSRVRDLDESKIRIFLAHDLVGDPESDFLHNGGFDQFHLLVFVSNWQMQRYIDYYQIPWSKCVVMPNAIDPIEVKEKSKTNIKLAYWSTPHRGLNILVPVFEKLCEKYDNIELDVFSSFNIYGWGERDKHFEEIFEACRNHPKINYHGSVDNKIIRDSIAESHILAYPSIWPETSCIVLMEAMSAGMLCVHPNYGALYETAKEWTAMYQWDEDITRHANAFYHMLDNSIESLNTPEQQSMLESQKAYANLFYNWSSRIAQWESLLRNLIRANPPRDLPKEQFVYRA